MADILNQHYRDIDGNMRNFTVVDHDKSQNTKINTTFNLSEENLDEKLKYDRELYQQKILALPASACPSIFDDFKVREGNSILWNETMIKDVAVPWTQLYNIYTLTSNKIEKSVGYGI